LQFQSFISLSARHSFFADSHEDASLPYDEFDETERAPSDDLKLQFEAVSRFPEEERIVKALLEGMILKHEATRWANA
jgi:hypothetical protein